MNPSEKIYLLIASLLGMIAIILWGSIVWRDPAKFRKMLAVDPGKWFVPILWGYRIILLFFTLVMLFIFFMTSLSLAGFIK